MVDWIADDTNSIAKRLKELEDERRLIASYTCVPCQDHGWIDNNVCTFCGNPNDFRPPSVKRRRV